MRKAGLQVWKDKVENLLFRNFLKTPQSINTLDRLEKNRNINNKKTKIGEFNMIKG